MSVCVQCVQLNGSQHRLNAFIGAQTMADMAAGAAHMLVWLVLCQVKLFTNVESYLGLMHGVCVLGHTKNV